MAIPGLCLSLFSSFQQLTENIKFIKFRRWLDSNRGPLASEATALPSEPQTLPISHKHCPVNMNAWLVSSLTGWCIQALHYERITEYFLLGRVQSSHTVDQLYSNTSPYKVSVIWCKQNNAIIPSGKLQRKLFIDVQKSRFHQQIST